jgi:hypothetical protein
MREIMTVSAELIEEAERVSELRKKMKAYLAKFGGCYDKFTITENDSKLGYISETAVVEYLRGRYGDRLEIKRWSDNFDMDKIKAAVENNDGSESEYVREYFYDEYDMKIIEKKSKKSILVDVKTAETRKKPMEYWDFLYPVVQNQRSGKDCVVLCYYYMSAEGNKVILVGYMSEEEISKKEILKAGEITKFGTVNQIDNYETKVKDYQELHKMLNLYYGYEN